MKKLTFEDVDEKLESKINKKLFEKSKKRFFDGFERNKVVSQVLDKTTMFTMYEMINSHIIEYVNGIIKAGKESVLFWAIGQNQKDIALKVYLVSTSNFKKRKPYIIGDPRFSKIKKGTKNLVYLWAQKEFSNLKRCHELGLPVVRPIHVSRNVLALDFIGKKGIPAKTLVETQVDLNDYQHTISILRRFYQEAKLVHSDFSEFNIFKTENGLVVFDLGSAVDLQHPNAMDFLKRDINNITKFFVKRGLTVEHPSDVLAKVIR
jgi:RIO kinase 1